MRLSKFIERAPEVKVKQRNGKSVATSVIGHASFVPIVTLWGAALFGLSVMVLSSVAIARISTLTGLGALGGYAQEIFALIAAALGALSGFILAAAVQNRVRKSAENGSLVSAMASRHKGPIDPAAELGSESLDAPIETVPFGADDWSADERDTQDSEFEELPAGLIADCSASSTQSDDDAPGFTRSDFRAALIETCEGATCEAATDPQHPEIGHKSLILVSLRRCRGAMQFGSTTRQRSPLKLLLNWVLKSPLHHLRPNPNQKMR